MIVIDRRDDPLFVIRIEGTITPEDLSVYRQLCEDLNARQCSYATVWVDEKQMPHCLHTQSESHIAQYDYQGPFAPLSRFWEAALARLRTAAT